MDKRIEKLKNLTIKKAELEALLNNMGFELKPGKGSHMKWVKPGCDVLVIATHTKDVARYQLKQALAVLKKAGLI